MGLILKGLPGNLNLGGWILSASLFIRVMLRIQEYNTIRTSGFLILNKSSW